MKVVVDVSRCQDQGPCVLAAPDVYSLDGDGRLVSAAGPRAAPWVTCCGARGAGVWRKSRRARDARHRTSPRCRNRPSTPTTRAALRLAMHGAGRRGPTRRALRHTPRGVAVGAVALGGPAAARYRARLLEQPARTA